jgi:hypothetical protein
MKYGEEEEEKAAAMACVNSGRNARAAMSMWRYEA